MMIRHTAIGLGALPLGILALSVWSRGVAPHAKPAHHAARRRLLHEVSLAAGANSAPQDAVPPLRGRLVLKSMPMSRLVGRQITTWIYLPPGYDDAANAARRYPVMYLLHGQPGGWTDCFLSGRVEEVADNLIGAGALPPLILVAFDGDGPRGAKDLTNFCNRADGYRAEDFIVQELVPYVDATYRTFPNAGQRALWGYSGGGYGALNLGFRHPDVWKVLCSHAGFYTPQQDAKTMRAVLGTPGPQWDANDPLRAAKLLSPGAGLHVYLAESRSAHEYSAFRHLAAELRARGVDCLTDEHPKSHAWDVVAAHCRTSLLFAARAFAAAPVPAPSVPADPDAPVAVSGE